MLEITITPTMLHFNNLSDEMQIKLTETYNDYNFIINEKGVHVKEKPQKLYKLLLELCYTYDIELS